MGGQKRPRKKRREIDTVGRNVLKKVPKGQPKGPQMEPKMEPTSSKIDTLASQMQQSFIFLSQEDPGDGYRLKKHQNLYKIRHNIVNNILANPIQNVSAQTVLADIPAEFPPVRAVKPHAHFRNSF